MIKAGDIEALVVEHVASCRQCKAIRKVVDRLPRHQRRNLRCPTLAALDAAWTREIDLALRIARTA